MQQNNWSQPIPSSEQSGKCNVTLTQFINNNPDVNNHLLRVSADSLLFTKAVVLLYSDVLTDISKLLFRYDTCDGRIRFMLISIHYPYRAGNNTHVSIDRL